MKTISKIASEIRGEKVMETNDLFNDRLAETLKQFNIDFQSVIPELIECSVDFRPCFWYQKKSFGDHFIYPPETKIDPTLNGGHGGICIANSMLFTFEHNGSEVKKRLFFNQEKGWYYIAKSERCTNDSFYIKNHRRDLILYLDGYFEGEYK